MNMETTLQENTRGSSEVIFIGLFTIFVASAGIGGMAVVNDLTSSSEDQIKQPTFELDSGNTNEIKYSGNSPITNTNTEKIWIEQEEHGSEYILYNSSGASDRKDVDEFGDINPDEVVINTTKIRQSPNIKTGTTTTIYWHSSDDTQKVVSEFYLPKEEVTGTALLSNGSITVENESNVSMGFNSPS